MRGERQRDERVGGGVCIPDEVKYVNMVGRGVCKKVIHTDGFHKTGEGDSAGATAARRCGGPGLHRSGHRCACP